MTRVLVAGGGVAGVAAAVAASRTGARVTLAEGSGKLALDTSLLPACLSRDQGTAWPRVAEPLDLAERYGIDVRLDEAVLSVDPLSNIALTQKGRLPYDAIVISTGSAAKPVEVKGASKEGVVTLDSTDRLSSLPRALAGLSRVAVAGPLPMSIVLAEAISRRSAVSLFLGSQSLPSFSRRVLELVELPASARGLRLVRGPIDAIVGVKRAEAVLSGGEVHPCDGVVILPVTSPSLPSLPSLDCVRGERGGVVVDAAMRTSRKGVYAAGECAELRCGSGSVPLRLHSSSSITGEAAGVNAAGGIARASPSRCLALDLFGVELCAAGLDVGGARRLGLDAVGFESGEDDGSLSVTLVHDRVTCRLYGVQLTGPGSLSLSDFVSFAVSVGASLQDLAYHETPDLPRSRIDHSPISLTAGRALARPRGQPLG